MGFLSQIVENLRSNRERTKAGRLSPDVSALGLFGGVGEWKNNKKLSNEATMKLYFGWVYACIRAIAEEIAGADLNLYTIAKDGKSTLTDNHELVDLIGSANDYQTGYELRYLTAAHLELVGNAFWYLENVKNENSKPTAIHILNPKNIKVLRSKTFPMVITGYEYKAGDETLNFKTYEILHFKSPDPNDALEGVGTTQNILQWIEADNFATEFNRRFFINGARIAGFLETENNYTRENLELLKKQFDEIYSGVANAYKVAALPKGTTFKAGSESQKDMDFVNLQTMMRDKILAGFRVPRTVLGITDDVNRANAEATNYIFALRTIKPKLELIESYLNEFLVPRYGDNIYLEFEDVVPENRELTIKEMEIATNHQAVMSVNEARDKYFGYPAIENGDAVMGDPNALPVGIPKPTPVQTEQSTRRVGAKKMQAQRAKKDFTETITKTITDKIAKSSTKLTVPDVQTMNDEEFGAIYKAFRTRVTKYEGKQIKNVQVVNNEIKKQVVENLPKTVKTYSAASLYDGEKAISLLVKITVDNYLDLYKNETLEAAKLIGLADFNPVTSEIRRALETSATLMAQSYNETTVQLLQKKIEEGIANGAGLSEMTDLVNNVFEYSDQVRAQTIARTETFRVANEANRMVWKESGVVKSLKWYTAEDERVCPYCSPIHDKVISIEQNFYDKGDEIIGSDGEMIIADYSDISNPPLHPSCRCYIRPEDINI